jgi:transmembrane sensor
MTQKNHIDKLFQKYFDKTASPKERSELMHLIHELNSDEELVNLMEEAYKGFVPLHNPFVLGKKEEIFQKIQVSIGNAKPKNAPAKVILHHKWFKYAIAASVTIFIGIAAYFFTSHHTDTQTLAADFNPGGNKAILTLSNGSTIILDNAKNGQLTSQGGTVVNKTNDGEIIYDASQFPQTETGAKPAYNTISTPKGGQYKVVLADGTRAWLNSVSSISFPTAFHGKDRQVEITGEVYFEVAKNKKKPFLVKAANQLVEVLGTHFNINSYDDEPDIKTTLLEGSVQIRQLNSNFSALLHPGQQAVNRSSGPILVQHVDIEQVIAWKNGMFQINDASIATLMRQASRWYNVDIEYEGKVPDRKFSGKIKRDVKASEFLQMLSYFNLHFSVEGQKIIIKN